MCIVRALHHACYCHEFAPRLGCMYIRQTREIHAGFRVRCALLMHLSRAFHANAARISCVRCAHQGLHAVGGNCSFHACTVLHIHFYTKTQQDLYVINAVTCIAFVFASVEMVRESLLPFYFAEDLLISDGSLTRITTCS
jgi:hypothetical protein